MCHRCSQSMPIVFDLEYHLMNCQIRNILCPVGHSTRYRCTMGYPIFIFHRDPISTYYVVRCIWMPPVHLFNHNWIIHSFTLQDASIAGYNRLYEK